MPSARKPQSQNKGRPPSSTSRRAIAERLTAELGVKITARMVQGWQGLGFDLDDLDALRRELATLQRPPGEDEGTEAGSLREQILKAELRRKLASADRLEQEAARLRGELMPTGALFAEGADLGRAVRAMLDKLTAQLPPMLAGRDAAEVQAVLRRVFREELTNLSHMQFADYINQALKP